ncbi:acyl-CoA dehydrogenase family protein [Pseudoalteromonas ruthenica]|uniref:acyl-CoA dehydrogenase family protein n=1 Tax=Pseudoalteromonas ruthenica TaxID=151081 RepID=UPI0012444BFE|nr:acyl-CoA dehydrogenase family protein [Pseudoalteromonas ruthenica]
MNNNSLADTHSVFNQPKPLANYNAFSADEVLQYWLTRFGGSWGAPMLCNFGEGIGGSLLEAGFLANKHLPEFVSHNRFGERIDQVDYHPAYHQLMRHAVQSGHCALPWLESKSGSHVVRGALAFLHSHADPGSGCPLTMTFASVPAIAVQKEVADRWLPKILSRHYDESNKPWYEKQGVTIGMAMTEKQGGSDVRANTTYATPVAASGPGKLYEIVGHKWFCSAPMCDGFLVLAQVEQQLSCFLVPRWREDGSKNPMHIQRLKNKLGNQSNASSEVEFRGAHGWLLGEPGRGIATIIQMVALTRYDCMLGSSALMAQAAKEAIWHTHERQAFGKGLHQQPLMRNVLADLAIEAEAALAISMRIANALDNQDDHHHRALVRSATAIGKYWICKRAVQHTYEAMECVGGVGYVNDNVLSRLYKEAPVNAIWEGSGNVQCLDLLRVLNKEPDTLKALLRELEQAKGQYVQFDERLEQLQAQLGDKAAIEIHARQIMESLALLWQGATLLIYGDPLIADAFVRSRLAPQSHHQYGTLNENIDMQAIIKRFMPKC